MTDNDLRLWRALMMAHTIADGDKPRQRDMTAPVVVVQVRPSPFPAGYTGCECTTTKACWRHG